MHVPKLAIVSTFVLMTFALTLPAQSKKTNPNKTAVISSIDKRSAELTRISDEVWANAETALREVKSSKALADYAESQGFNVRRGVAGMPTAFIAEYGSGKP